MNLLLAEMKRSLAELDLGLKGDLTVSEPMERLMRALATDAVPARWAARGRRLARRLCWARNEGMDQGWTPADQCKKLQPLHT